MTARRNDDLAAFVAARERVLGSKSKKVLQSYEAFFAAAVPDTELDNAGHAVDKLLGQRNKRYQFREISTGPGWIAGRAVYEARGANADDLEKKLMGELGITEDDVAIDTISVRPIGDGVL